MLDDILGASVYALAQTRVIDVDTVAVLAELERATHLRVLSPQMLSGSLQGEFLAFFSQMIRPKLVVEVGSFTGYSAICLAQGLAEGGRLHTIEYDEELELIIREFVEKAGLAAQIELHIGDAKGILPTLPDEIDLAFIDADKLAYGVYYETLLPKLRAGGYMLIDNILWHGKVYSPAAKDAKTQYLRDFAAAVRADERVKVFLLPLRDGLLLVQKNKSK
jgi:predicted O-methyltransferase YrrM